LGGCVHPQGIVHPPLGCFTPALDLTGDSKDLPSAPHHGPPSAVSNAGPYHEARGPWPEAEMEGGTRQTAGRRTGECIRQAGGLGRNALGKKPSAGPASSACGGPCFAEAATRRQCRRPYDGTHSANSRARAFEVLYPGARLDR
jgi:hypothetical protein